MYHQITIYGRLGQEPNLRYTPGGTAVVNLSVATSKTWKDKEGNKQAQTIWFKVSVWGAQAESCNQYLTKGQSVLITGEMQSDENGNPKTFVRNNGQTSASFEVRAQQVIFGGKGRQDAVPKQETVSENDIPF